MVQENNDKLTVLQIGEGKLLRILIDPGLIEMKNSGWNIDIAITNIRENEEESISKLKENGYFKIVLRDDRNINKSSLSRFMALGIKDD